MLTYNLRNPYARHPLNENPPVSLRKQVACYNPLFECVYVD